MAPLVASPKVSRHTRRLLSAGIAAGPLFLVAWGFQAFTRDGFDPVVRIRIRGGRVVVDGGLLHARRGSACLDRRRQPGGADDRHAARPPRRAVVVGGAPCWHCDPPASGAL